MDESVVAATRPSWMEIDLDALVHNYLTLRAKVGPEPHIILPADITPRTRDATIYYVDLGLPPGRGAGAMVEKYGEERVLLRDKGTCPRSD